MLAYFKPGTGKSILSINVGIKFLKKNHKSRILFLANKSLHANYLIDLKKYILLYYKKFKIDLTEYLKKIDFMTLNAGNVKDLFLENKQMINKCVLKQIRSVSCLKKKI